MADAASEFINLEGFSTAYKQIPYALEQGMNSTASGKQKVGAGMQNAIRVDERGSVAHLVLRTRHPVVLLQARGARR